MDIQGLKSSNIPSIYFGKKYPYFAEVMDGKNIYRTNFLVFGGTPRNRTIFIVHWLKKIIRKLDKCVGVKFYHYEDIIEKLKINRYIELQREMVQYRWIAIDNVDFSYASSVRELKMFFALFRSVYESSANKKFMITVAHNHKEFMGNVPDLISEALKDDFMALDLKI